MIGRDRDGIARVDTHRIDVLDTADNHAVVVLVTHGTTSEFVFLPAKDGFVYLHPIDAGG